MVGKRRLNKRRRLGRRKAVPSRRAGRDDSPFSCRPGAGRVGVEDGMPEALSLELLNQERNKASSIGRRSDCQSRKTPPARNTKSASQTPAAGERRPWRAKDTPITEIE